MRKQTTNKILMIEPVAFGYNYETAINNHFQHKISIKETEIQKRSLDEFNNMVHILNSNGVTVLVVKDTPDPPTPDSIFPNNWVSFHGEGQVVIYPMYAKNRRTERRTDILEYLNNQCCDIKNIDDFTFWEEQNLFLEGTGSMVLDRENGIAYATLSERTDKTVFLQFCKVFEFEPIFFNANQTINGKRLPIFHTNLMLSVATDYAVICEECIDDSVERNLVLESLRNSKKEIIFISEEQMEHFAGNMLQIENDKSEKILVLSQTAYNSLEKQQIDKLTTYNKLIPIPIPTIEEIGGGSVRCMMAELF